MEATPIQKLVNVLQCPSCSGQMVPPLMQCALGHHCCNKCFSDNEYCQKCQFPMGNRRNYSLEKLCFSHSLKCSFAPDGCSFTDTCIIVAEHERSCEVFQKRHRNSASSSEEAIRPIGDSNGQSLVEALFAILECPVCLSVILPPIGECSNGHQLCYDCFQRVDHCPICRIPNTYVINIMLGNIFEMMVISCRNAGGGCEIRGSAPSVLRHEKSCDYVVKFCPLRVDGICKWQGAMCHLLEHCRNTHSDRLILKSEYTCISQKFEDQFAYHNLFYIDGVWFRFGWYACDGVYRFSVNSFGYVGNENRYSYEIKIFHRTAKYLLTRLVAQCVDLEDGDISFLNRQCIAMSGGRLVNYFKECGEITYVVRIIDHRM